MDPTRFESLRRILLGQELAALGTLHNGAPAVSMVPYAILPETGEVVIHVSRLATHTRDLEAAPAVSLLVVGERAPGVPAQAVPRATLSGEARPCPRGADGHAAARAAYLDRFPDSEPMFGFADFSLYLVAPRFVRFVGGFAEATTLRAQAYRDLVRGGT